MKRLLVLLLIILIAFFLRVWQLPQLPPGLWYDEAYNALDALWAVETGHYPAFFAGNNGREPMWHYLVLLSTSVLGHTTFAVRLAGSIAGVITIPIMYRFASAFLAPFAMRSRHRCWLALVAAGWLAVSWWHLLNSRGGFRPVLLPPVLMLALYFWLPAIKQAFAEKGRFPVAGFALAGLFLGLTQYTYLPARLAPFIFIGFVLLWSLQLVWFGRKKSWPALRRLWLGLLVTLVVAALIFMPLGLFYFNNLQALSSRTGDVFFSPNTVGEAADHLWQAVTLFLGAGHELYRHHLPGRAMLGWLEIPFFFIGLAALLRPSSLKRAETQLILLGFVAMWLPALLAAPPVHALRPIGLLPFYYLLVTLGLYYVARWVANIWQNTQAATRLAFVGLPVVILGATGLINAYDYFQRWANQPETYIEYNGPLVDLMRDVIKLTETENVIIPLQLYVHPTTRYLLWDSFPEVDGPLPPRVSSAEMVLIPDNFQLLYVGNIPASPAMVLLTRDSAGQGAAYISRPPRADEQPVIIDGLAASQEQIRPFADKLGRAVAQFVPLEAGLLDTLAPLFDPASLRSLDNLNWGGLAQLVGYDVTPQVAEPGENITLNLYWHSLTDETFAYRLFLQLIDGAGNPINQWEVNAYNEDMYRWRPDGLLPTQHILNLPDNVAPGSYLVRIGFFDPASGKRLPLWVDGQPVDIDQIQLGLFYVTPDGTDPRRPDTSLSANFADSIQLVGVTIPQIDTASGTLPAPHPLSLAITLHWQTIQPTDKPYTVFLQLLNEQGEVVGGWDQQPFGGLYPTNLWSPGEMIADIIQLPLPEGGLPPGKYGLITGFYDVDTGQRMPVIGGSDFAPLAEFVVE